MSSKKKRMKRPEICQFAEGKDNACTKKAVCKFGDHWFCKEHGDRGSSRATRTRQGVSEIRWVFFIMVEISTGWIRVGNAYATRKGAEGWLDFVSAAKGGRPARVEGLELVYIDGELDERTIRALDEKFNLDKPEMKKMENKTKEPDEYVPFLERIGSKKRKRFVKGMNKLKKKLRKKIKQGGSLRTTRTMEQRDV